MEEMFNEMIDDGLTQYGDNFIKHLLDNQNKFVEEFAIWLERETVVDNHDEIMKCIRDVGKTLSEDLYGSEKISCTDTYKLVWEQ